MDLVQKCSIGLPDISPHPQKILPDNGFHMHRIKHSKFRGTFFFRRQSSHLLKEK